MSVEHSLAAEQQLFQGRGGWLCLIPKPCGRAASPEHFQGFSIHKHHQGFDGGIGVAQCKVLWMLLPSMEDTEPRQSCGSWRWSEAVGRQDKLWPNGGTGLDCFLRHWGLGRLWDLCDRARQFVLSSSLINFGVGSTTVH